MLAARIMVVEDEAIVALHLRQQLERLGYLVPAVVASSELALKRAGELRPDLVLMDIRIDGSMDGIDTAARIVERYKIPVIYLSAFAGEAMLIRARETRPYGYLVKPFSERELHAAIQMALARRLAEHALLESREHLKLSLDAAEMGSWELDPQTRCFRRSGLADAILGIEAKEFDGTLTGVLRLVHARDQDAVGRLFDRMLVERTPCDIEFRIPADAGQVRWIKLKGQMFERPGSGGEQVIGVVQDITQRREADHRLRQASTVFEATRDGMLILDQRLRVADVNRGFVELTGYARDWMIGRKPHFLHFQAEKAGLFRDFARTLKTGQTWHGEIRCRRSDGVSFPGELTVAAVRSDNGELIHYVAAIADLTAVRKAEQELQRLAHYDPLTGLPNRLLAMDRLEHALERANRRGLQLGLLFVDMDDFKLVNDRLGHAAGDELLRAVAGRMTASIRAEDTVARLGGDEFVVIIEDVGDSEQLARIAGKILGAISQRLVLAGTEITPAASIGIGIYPQDGRSREELIEAADVAMYAAKQPGDRSYAFHTSAMSAVVSSQVAQERDLRQAFARGELCLHYQPQFCLRTERVTGVEALLRWEGPAGLVEAGAIIPVAERSSLIMEIGDWTTGQACAQAARWQDAGSAPLRIGVNASPRQLARGRLVAGVERALAASSLPAGTLEIEVAESTLQGDEDILATLDALASQGAGIAIDDFGSGYSALGMLRALPVERLKLGAALIRDLPDDPEAAAIVEAVVTLAHRLQIKVLAKGVETAEQDACLRRLGCDEAQGYFYARPMPADEVPGFLRRHVAPVLDLVMANAS